MNPVTIRALVVCALVALGVAGAVSAPATSSSEVGNAVLAHAVAVELGQVPAGPKELPVSAGPTYAALQATGALEARANQQQGSGHPKPISKHGTQGCQNRFEGGGQGGANIRVNQDCSLRRQAEEVVVVNPLDDDNLIAGQNDSRLGFNHCGYDWSFDGGKTWGDQTPPFWQFILLDGHTADACSDPTATFDSKGNAYVGGIIFDVVSAANAIVVAKSNNPIGGAFYHSPFPLSFQTYRTVPLGVVANDNNPTIFNDKELIVADATASSPKADNVYATWTKFSGGHSPIYFSQSTNGGANWSPGIEIDGVNPSICTFPTPGPCNDNQGSHPIVGPDGTIYVIFGNANTPLPGINQVVMVKCPAAANCSSSASWTAPVKINDLIGTHPIGDPGNSAGCPVGRQCLPPNGYRVPEFTSMSLSIDQGGKLYAVWSDFRNGDNPGSTCGPFGAWSTRTPPCNNDVFYSFSTNGGATWSPEVNVAPAAANFGPTAQWQPWSKVTKDGTLYVAYYDRSYGNCEFSGCNDITLAKVTKAASASPTIKYTRLTTESMPNLVLANNPLQAGFLGDYMWVDLDSKSRPLVVWADTRGLDGTVEEDIYIARPVVP